VHFLTIHKLHTNEMHYIFTFHSLTPTYEFKKNKLMVEDTSSGSILSFDYEKLTNLI
jgi:hypothetical protein